MDLTDHGEDGFHVGRCVRRYVEMVTPRRFRILLPFPVNWRTDSVRKGVSPKLCDCGQWNLLQRITTQSQDCRMLLNFFFLMRRVSPLINPSRCASFSRTWHVDAASSELGSTLILVSGLPEAIDIPLLSDAIGLDATEELVAINEEDIFVTAGRDFDKNLFSSCWFRILFVIVGSLPGWHSWYSCCSFQWCVDCSHGPRWDLTEPVATPRQLRARSRHIRWRHSKLVTWRQLSLSLRSSLSVLNCWPSPWTWATRSSSWSSRTASSSPSVHTWGRSACSPIRECFLRRFPSLLLLMCESGSLAMLSDNVIFWKRFFVYSVVLEKIVLSKWWRRDQ